MEWSNSLRDSISSMDSFCDLKRSAPTPDIYWLQISVQGRFWCDFSPLKLDLPMSKSTRSFSEKKCWIFSVAVTLALSGHVRPSSSFFPGIPVRQRCVFARKVKRCQPKKCQIQIDHISQNMTWSFSSSCKEIGPKGRNVANCVLLRILGLRVAHLLEGLWSLSHFGTNFPCLMMFALTVSCAWRRCCTTLNLLAPAGTIGWCLGMFVSLWDHTVLLPSSCLRGGKENIVRLLNSFHVISSCPSESLRCERAQYNAVGRTSLKDTCESILHLESARFTDFFAMLAAFCSLSLRKHDNLKPFVFDSFWLTLLQGSSCSHLFSFFCPGTAAVGPNDHILPAKEEFGALNSSTRSVPWMEWILLHAKRQEKNCMIETHWNNEILLQKLRIDEFWCTRSTLKLPSGQKS